MSEEFQRFCAGFRKSCSCILLYLFFHTGYPPELHGLHGLAGGRWGGWFPTTAVPSPECVSEEVEEAKRRAEGPTACGGTNPDSPATVPRGCEILSAFMRSSFSFCVVFFPRGAPQGKETQASAG